ncbi:MAG: transposase [Desulfobulbus sp.]
MNGIQYLSHTKWECKYHMMWIPKCRRKMLHGALRKNLVDVFHDLTRSNKAE